VINLEKNIKKTKKRRIISIGSDPEFIFVQGKTKYDAREALRKKNALSEDDGDRCSTQIGTDGCASTGELRPTYANSPEGHFNNIKTLIGQLYNISKGEFKIMGGNFPSFTSLGGHIHFGNLPDGIDSNKMAELLDIYLSLPLLLVEEEEPARKRRTGSYGKLGQIRRQSWGQEYRTPASWILHPDIAMAVLCLSYTIIDHYINNLDYKANKILLDYIKKTDSFNMAKIKDIEPFIVHCYEEITKMDLFPKYKKEINLIFKMIQRGEKWDESKDMLCTWGFKGKEENKTQLLHSKDKGIANICSGIKINSKKDTNLTLYIYGLSEAREHDTLMTSNNRLRGIVESILYKRGKKTPSFKAFRLQEGVIGTKANAFISAIGVPYNLRTSAKDELKIIIQDIVDEYEKDE
jgi:hypothetical protein